MLIQRLFAITFVQLFILACLIPINSAQVIGPTTPTLAPSSSDGSNNTTSSDNTPTPSNTPTLTTPTSNTLPTSSSSGANNTTLPPPITPTTTQTPGQTLPSLSSDSISGSTSTQPITTIPTAKPTPTPPPKPKPTNKPKTNQDVLTQVVVENQGIVIVTYTHVETLADGQVTTFLNVATMTQGVLSTDTSTDTGINFNSAVKISSIGFYLSLLYGLGIVLVMWAV